MDLVAPNAQLANINFCGWDLSGADLSAATLSHAGFRNAVLSEAKLDSATLIFALFKEANLEGATLTNVRLRGSDFTIANLQGANLDDADHSHFDGEETLPRITCWGLDQVLPEGSLDRHLSEIYGANRPTNQDIARGWRFNALDMLLPMSGTVNKLPFEYSDLDQNMAKRVYWYLFGADFGGADMRRVSARRAWLTGSGFKRTNMAGIDLTSAVLSHSILDWACLEGSTLYHTNFEMCSIKNVDFNHANLKYTNFYYANLSGSTFKRCNLTGSNFEGADLTDVDFTETGFEGKEFRGSNFQEAKLSTAQLRAIESGIEQYKRKAEAEKRAWDEALKRSPKESN